MTYFGFLGLFVVIPIIILTGLTLRDYRRGLSLPFRLSGWPAWPVLVIHIIIALVYTTPWDNYLVATRVWWYDPNLVTGITFGWVPLEEYTFFVLQPLLTGLWLLHLARHLPPFFWAREQGSRGAGEQKISPALPPFIHRLLSTSLVGLIWLGAVLILLSGWQPGTYLALELGWALPPIMLQLAFGADILWRQRRLVLLSLLFPTLYLSFADAIAIEAGTWTINPAQSLNIFLGGSLPLEEFFFFLLTNILIVFGMTLALAPESRSRVGGLRKYLDLKSA
jgi:lycopene cyclase domain-containing protein